jgi:hypothetical protein
MEQLDRQVATMSSPHIQHATLARSMGVVDIPVTCRISRLTPKAITSEFNGQYGWRDLRQLALRCETF